MARGKESFVCSIRQQPGWRKTRPIVTVGQGNHKETRFWGEELEFRGNIEALVRHHDPLNAQRVYGREPDENPVKEAFIVTNPIQIRQTNRLSQLAHIRNGTIFESAIELRKRPTTGLYGEIMVALLKAS